MRRPTRSKPYFLCVLLACTVFTAAHGQTAQPAPVEVARNYFEAMERKDLVAAKALFASSSSLFETGGNEGDWASYRDHHIGAELDAFKTFKTALGAPEEEVSADGTMDFVAWPIEYQVILKDDRKIDSRGTVTFVLIRTGESFRIRHLHWSSRRKQGGSH